jgi:hypothetical protein
MHTLNRDPIWGYPAASLLCKSLQWERDGDGSCTLDVELTEAFRTEAWLVVTEESVSYVRGPYALADWSDLEPSVPLVE